MIYTKPPLPYQLGNKQCWVKQMQSVLSTIDTSQIDTIVDMYGGSGILARVSKDVLPSCRVVYNDYDNYEARLKLYPRTYKLLQAIGGACKDVSYGAIPRSIIDYILRLVRREAVIYPVDWESLTRACVFSADYASNYEEFARKCRYWRGIKWIIAEDVSDYLDGLIIERLDFRALYAKYNGDNVLYIMDPPYLQTMCEQYRGTWAIGDYLDLMSLILRMKRYILFTSERSETLELMRWADHNLQSNFLSGAQQHTRHNMTQCGRGYIDIMLTRL